MKISLSNQEGLPTLYQRFWENAKIAPTSLAIIDDTSDVSTTYATLLADASEVAARIVAVAPQLLPEEPFGAPFLSGATLVIVPPEVARDLNALCSAFGRHQVSFAGLPTALFNIVSRVRPETFNTLRSVMFGGEATNLQAVKSVLSVAPSTLSLFTCYGPTECSVFALCYKLNPSLKNIQEDNRIPIGAAYDKTTVFRVVDDSFRVKEVSSDASLS
ncbi:hypothetical protein ONZ45_g13999 [Pleurotus djamor]|nr:hypothetical protein ONZ45_g13999 [Pleurotus djamor]